LAVLVELDGIADRAEQRDKLIYNALDALEAACAFRKAGNIDAALIMRAMSQRYMAAARKVPVRSAMLTSRDLSAARYL
jgi:hypothetical protein